MHDYMYDYMYDYLYVCMYVCMFVRMSIFVSMCALRIICSSDSKNRMNHGRTSLPFLTYHIYYLSRDGKRNITSL